MSFSTSTILEGPKHAVPVQIEVARGCETDNLRISFMNPEKEHPVALIDIDLWEGQLNVYVHEYDSEGVMWNEAEHLISLIGDLSGYEKGRA